MSLFARSNYNTSYADVESDRQFVIKQLLELVKNGADFLRDRNPTEATAENWIGYSEKIVELATKRYDTNIFLSYLRLLLTIRHSNHYGPYQRVKACLDYLLDVVGVLTNSQ